MFGGVTPGRFDKMYKNYVDHYPKESVVKIHYDPNTPENAVLKANGTIGYKKYYLFACFAAVCGAFLVNNYYTRFGDRLLDFIER